MEKAYKDRITDLLTQVGINSTASAELLLITAEFLESGQPLPTNLSTFLVRSIRDSMAEPSTDRGTQLLFALGLSAPGKEGRPKLSLDSNEIHQFVLNAILEDSDFSETKLKKRVAQKFEISETKALEFIKPSAFVPKLLKTNGMKGLLQERKFNNEE